MKYSVVVLTKNEETAIRECISSVTSDDIWVVDSESTDNTVAIVESLNNLVLVNKPFENYANQRNFALKLNFKYQWVLMLDADERLSKTARSFLDNLDPSEISDDISMVSFLRHDYFLGRWLRGASGYPLHFPRLFRKDSVTVRREINEEYYSVGKNLNVKHHIDHYPFIKGIHYWYDRHNVYSSLEVEALASNSNGGSYRSKLKSIFYKLPFRYLIMFFYLYVFKRGFLAGYPGFLFCIMRASYEIMIVAKQKEKKNECAKSYGY